MKVLYYITMTCIWIIFGWTVGLLAQRAYLDERPIPSSGIAIKVCGETPAIVVAHSDGTLTTLHPPFDEHAGIKFPKGEFELVVDVDGCESNTPVSRDVI